MGEVVYGESGYLVSEGISIRLRALSRLSVPLLLGHSIQGVLAVEECPVAAGEIVTRNGTLTIHMHIYHLTNSHTDQISNKQDRHLALTMVRLTFQKKRENKRCIQFQHTRLKKKKA